MNQKEQAQFFIRTGDLLKNGFTFIEVLQFLSHVQTEYSSIFSKIESELRKGSSIHETLIKLGFDHQACMALYFAEKHGNLEVTFKTTGQYLLKKVQDKEKWRKILFYPFLLCCLLIVMCILISYFLVPRFQFLYRSMGYYPKGISMVLIYLLEHITLYSFVTFLIIILSLILMKRFLHKRSPLDKARMWTMIPLIKEFYILYQTIFFSREWAFLLQSGFSLNDIIQLMENQDFHLLMKETGKLLKETLLFGDTFSSAMNQLFFLEKEMMVIVSHGENSGQLDRELLYYSQMCIEKLDDKMKKWLVIAQPVIFSFIGLFVIFVYMSLFIPMFQMLDTI